MEYYSAIRKNEILPCVQLVDGIKQWVKQRKANTVFHLYVESKKTSEQTKQK